MCRSSNKIINEGFPILYGGFGNCHRLVEDRNIDLNRIEYREIAVCFA